MDELSVSFDTVIYRCEDERLTVDPFGHDGFSWHGEDGHLCIDSVGSGARDRLLIL